jgi:hypothetical protein
MPTNFNSGTVPPPLETPEDLAAFIRAALAAKGRCAIYQRVLDVCWPIASYDQAKQVFSFAIQNGWDVEILEVPMGGRVAEFRKLALYSGMR